MTDDERIAVSEAKLERNEKDITALFELIRKHMAKEEKDREELLKHISDINAVVSRQKTFVGAVVFTITSIWAVITSITYFILKIKGS